jgi:tetratricopeptide (TPR) repeat protein
VLLDLASDTEGFDEEQFLGFALSQFATNESAVQQLRQGLGQLQDPGKAKTRGRIHYAMGGLLVNAGQDDEAVPAFFKAVELAPDLLDAHIKLGNAFARAANFDQALGQYEKVLQLAPTHMAALVKHSATLMSLQRFAEAKAELIRIRQMEPTNSEAVIRLAQCHEQLAETGDAIARYRDALTHALNVQDRTEVPFHIALLDRQDGKIEAAEESYRQSLAADADYRPSLSGLASLLAQGGRLKEAAELYNRLAGLEPELLAPRLAEATALILSGQHAVAKERLEAGILLFPEEPQLKDILARHLAASPDLSIRDGRRAVELAEAVFNQIPTLESSETLAMAYAEAGRFKDAVEWQKQLLLKVPENADPKGLQRLRANLALYEASQRCCASSG